MASALENSRNLSSTYQLSTMYFVEMTLFTSHLKCEHAYANYSHLIATVSCTRAKLRNACPSEVMHRMRQIEDFYANRFESQNRSYSIYAFLQQQDIHAIKCNSTHHKSLSRHRPKCSIRCAGAIVITEYADWFYEALCCHGKHRPAFTCKLLLHSNFDGFASHTFECSDSN